MEKQFQAYHNDSIQKAKYISIMEQAVNEERLISGEYWCEDNHRGCLVGQIGHDGRHSQFSDDLQTPIWFAYLVDSIFEGLSDGKRQVFAMNLIKTIPVGFSHWQSWHHKFCVFILEDVCCNTDNPIIMQAVSDIIILHKKQEQDKHAWFTAWSAGSAAESAAESAAWSARSAAWSAGSAGSAESTARSARSAAESAAESAARSAAESAAESAAWSAGSAAESAAGSAESTARSAAESAAWSARSAAWSAGSAESAAWSAGSAESAAWSAGSAAWSAAYKKMGKKTLSLFKDKYT